MLCDPSKLVSGRITRRESSWNRSGGNRDLVTTAAGEQRVLALCEGPGVITHIWMAVPHSLREVLLQVTVDGADSPQIQVPIGDFFCLGHGRMANFQSLYFSCSTNKPDRFGGCSFNCYLPMPFRRSFEIALVNEGKRELPTWYYIDWETRPAAALEGSGILHAEFRRANPFGGWAPHLPKEHPPLHEIPCTEEFAWEYN